MFFEGDINFALDPMDPGSTLLRILQDAYSRGVDIRILANINLYLPTNAVSMCHDISKFCSDCCVPETHHGHWSGALHAKTWIIQRAGEVIAMVGGTDVQDGRYDTPEHNFDEVRKRSPQDMQPFWGWHDMMNYIQGPAAVDFARQFYLQWHDPAKDLPTYGRKPFTWIDPVVPVNPGTLDIQFLRTLSCYGATQGQYYQNYAPMGEISAMNAFMKMIRLAKKYIYLADQFAFFDEALEEVTKVMDTIDALVILTDDAISFKIVTSMYNITTAQDMRYYYQRRALQKLTAKPSWAAKVHIYTLMKMGASNDPENLKTENIIYVHSKNFIVDDKYMITGSMGLERTGFTNDIELAIGIYDTKGEWVKQVRKQLWAEHLMINVTDPLLEDPLVAVKEWDRQATAKNRRVRSYYPREVELTSGMKFLYEIYEPEGRCNQQPEQSDYHLDPTKDNSGFWMSISMLIAMVLYLCWHFCCQKSYSFLPTDTPAHRGVITVKRWGAETFRRFEKARSESASSLDRLRSVSLSSVGEDRADSFTPLGDK
jgi:phosphatidylserine/phosphatidylglycerophosphate/cardiolipin synthase-like enzyme